MTTPRTIAATATAAGLAVVGGVLAVGALSSPAQAAPSSTVQASRSWAAPAPSVQQAKGSTWAGHTAQQVKGSTWAGHTAVQPAAKWWKPAGAQPSGILLAARKYDPARKFGPASITLASSTGRKVITPDSSITLA